MKTREEIRRVAEQGEYVVADRLSGKLSSPARKPPGWTVQVERAGMAVEVEGTDDEWLEHVDRMIVAAIDNGAVTFMTSFGRAYISAVYPEFDRTAWFPGACKIAQGFMVNTLPE